MAKTTADLIDQVLNAATDQLYRVIGDGARAHPFNQAMQSPLEQVVGYGLFTGVFIYNAMAMARGKKNIAAFQSEVRESFGVISKLSDLPLVTVWHQVKVDAYVADFMVRAQLFKTAPPIWIAVECDGHDFHERTKEQAAHDRSRDRHFQKLGIFVLRFTGAEIWRDPVSVTDQVFEFINERTEA